MIPKTAAEVFVITSIDCLNPNLELNISQGDLFGEGMMGFIALNSDETGRKE